MDTGNVSDSVQSRRHISVLCLAKADIDSMLCIFVSVHLHNNLLPAIVTLCRIERLDHVGLEIATRRMGIEFRVYFKLHDKKGMLTLDIMDSDVAR